MRYSSDGMELVVHAVAAGSGQSLGIQQTEEGLQGIWLIPQRGLSYLYFISRKLSGCIISIQYKEDNLLRRMPYNITIWQFALYLYAELAKDRSASTVINTK